MENIAEAHLDALGEWDTPALSNALDSLRLRARNTGYTDGSIQRIAGTGIMTGIAVTARMRAREPADDGIAVSQLHRAIASVTGPVVVVIEDADEPPGAGAFLGEVNGSLLQALNVRGLVTNGRVRDVRELRDLGYSVYAAGVCVARAYMRLIDIGNPVTVGGLTVQSGDILHGDEHGILEIPPAALPSIFGQAEIIRAEERQVVTWSRSPEFSIEGLLALRRVRH